MTCHCAAWPVDSGLLHPWVWDINIRVGQIIKMTADRAVENPEICDSDSSMTPEKRGFGVSTATPTPEITIVKYKDFGS